MPCIEGLFLFVGLWFRPSKADLDKRDSDSLSLAVCSGSLLWQREQRLQHYGVQDSVSDTCPAPTPAWPCSARA
jgi:hypothetical protein